MKRIAVVLGTLTLLSVTGVSGAAVAGASTANALPRYFWATAYPTSINTQWSASPTAHVGVTDYRVQLALARTGVVQQDIRTTANSYLFTGLTPSTRYEWRMYTGQDAWHLASVTSAWRVVTTTAGTTPPPATVPDGVPSSQVGALSLNATG